MGYSVQCGRVVWAVEGFRNPYRPWQPGRIAGCVPGRGAGEWSSVVLTSSLFGLGRVDFLS